MCMKRWLRHREGCEEFQHLAISPFQGYYLGRPITQGVALG